MKDNRSKSSNDAHAKKTLATRRAALADSDAVFASMDKRASEQFFAGRGFSQDTIKALAAHGIVLPEELLFMPASRIKRISFGSEKAALAEIRSYRKQFLGEPKYSQDAGHTAWGGAS